MFFNNDAKIDNIFEQTLWQTLVFFVQIIFIYYYGVRDVRLESIILFPYESEKNEKFFFFTYKYSKQPNPSYWNLYIHLTMLDITYNRFQWNSKEVHFFKKNMFPLRSTRFPLCDKDNDVACQCFFVFRKKNIMYLNHWTLLAFY